MYRKQMRALSVLSAVAAVTALNAQAKPGDGAYINVKPISKKALVIRASVVDGGFALRDDAQTIALDIDAHPGESWSFNGSFSIRFGSDEKTGRVSDAKVFESAPTDVIVELTNSDVFKGAWVEAECHARLQHAANKSNKSTAALLTSGWWTSFKTSIPIEVRATADDPWTPFIQQLPRRGDGIINGVTIMCGKSGPKGVMEAGMGPGFQPQPQGPEGQGGRSGSAEPKPPRDTKPARQTKPPREPSSSDSSAVTETTIVSTPSKQPERR